MRRLMAASFLAGALAFPAVTSVSAAPTCDGKPATHVGTNGNNTIRGTAGADVIVGKGGKDTIKGRGGRDRLCGGNGDDRILGGGANDRIFGQAEHDFLEGGDGDDRIVGADGDDFLFGDDGQDHLDGGDDFDACFPFPGIGDMVRCEDADFVVDVSSPAQTSEESITFMIEVTNKGPDEVSYLLHLEVDNPDLDCGSYPWEGSSSQPILAINETDHIEREVTCDNPRGNDPHVNVFALVTPRASDPEPGNNTDESTTHAVVE